MKTADSIKQARALIESGWHRGDYRNEEGTAFCLIGALEHSDSAVLYGGTAAESALEETIRCAYPEEAVRADKRERRLLSYFNDEVALSKQDVLTIIDKCLAGLGAMA